jgi:hypothetical protein
MPIAEELESAHQIQSDRKLLRIEEETIGTAGLIAGAGQWSGG